MLYARSGAAVLTYDPLGEGERNPEKRSGSRAHDLRKQTPELGPHMAGQMITDVRQAVGYLSQCPEVDARRISAVGYSLGSFVLALSCAVEARINSCALVGGGNLDSTGGYWDRSKPLCQAWPYQSLNFLGDRAAALYALHASHGTTFAVYQFLERFLGVRWFWPGECGEVVPVTKNLALALSSRTEEPAYLWRSLGPGGALWGPYDRWEAELRIGISPEHQKVHTTGSPFTPTMGGASANATAAALSTPGRLSLSGPTPRPARRASPR